MLRSALVAFLFAFSSVSLAEPAFQKLPIEKPAKKLLEARAMYYTPTTAGLRGFHCTVEFEWARLFQQLGNPLPDDSPVLHYLRSVRLSVSDSLKTGGQLEWADTGTPPDAFARNAAQLRDGLKQTIFGFFSSWNGYMNGSMVPVPDDATTIVQTAKGYRLHTASKEYDVTEDFDTDFLLKQAHVITDALDIVSSPSFEQMPGGLRVSSVASTVRQPKTAAPVQMTMSTTYGTVSGFQIPASIKVEILNSARFEFPLSNCSVDTETR